MPGNSWGQIFQLTTFGESHGPAIGVVIDGVMPLVPLCEADIQVELNRRRPGQSAITTPRAETDTVEILSGVFEGKTTGTPIALLIRNRDAKTEDYQKLKDIFRPGHADYTYLSKYGIRDWRGSGRASGRETAARVAAGAIAKKILAQQNIRITAYTLAVAGIYAKKIDLNAIESNPVRCPDSEQAQAMIAKIEEARKNNDSVGGIVEAVIDGCPPGLGEPVFDKLSARLAAAMMSIGTVKGVEIGSGFECAKMRGSECNDVFVEEQGKIKTKTNHAGGILGGISTGGQIKLRVAVKPPSSIGVEQETVTKEKKMTALTVSGRHDPCVCPRVVPVVEAMLAVTLVDCLMLHRAVNGPSK
ncbi:MAG TPA: chorismate synthase [Candidatus Omnitrophota bacterium]|nr:chorismate synthase [Candidatus Omnitrophota bacterium]HPD85423.1 chorismate synthase [Candidatus Omnitrophota bacterium]HRZ04076.1 chorismate synthase [Candidatus Omnitrophota bacterium]